MMRAIETGEVKRKMKCVVSELGTVVDELSIVTVQLRAVLRQIDRVTYALLQGCEHGLRSPELEEATLKSIVPKLTHAKVSHPVESPLNDGDTKPSADTRRETSLKANEPVKSVRRKLKPSLNNKAVKSDRTSRGKPDSFPKKTSSAPCLEKIDRHRSQESHRKKTLRFEKDVDSTKRGLRNTTAGIDVGQKPVEKVHYQKKTSFRQTPVTKKIHAGNPPLKWSDARKGTTNKINKENTTHEMAATQSKEFNKMQVSHDAKHQHCSDTTPNKCLTNKPSTEAVKLCGTASHHEPKRNTAAANLYRLINQKKADSLPSSPYVDSSEGTNLLNDYRSSDSDVDKTTPLFSSPMHHPVALETDDSEGGHSVNDYEASYNRSINTWTTYAIVHIDNTSEEEGLLLNEALEVEDKDTTNGDDEDDDDDEDEQGETHPHSKGL